MSDDRGHGLRPRLARRRRGRASSQAPGRRALRARLPHYPVESGFLEFARPILREGLDRLRAPRRRRSARGAGHAVRGRPRQERRALGAERLCRRARPQDRVRPRSRRSTPSCCARRATGSRRRERARGSAGAARGDAARGDRARHLGPRRQRQRRQGRAHAVGGHGLRLGRGRLQRRRPSARRCALERAGRLGFRRIVVFPYFLFTGVLVQRIYAPDRRGRGPPSRDRVRQGRLSRRPPAGARRLRRARSRASAPAMST